MKCKAGRFWEVTSGPPVIHYNNGRYIILEVAWPGAPHMTWPFSTWPQHQCSVCRKASQSAIRSINREIQRFAIHAASTAATHGGKNKWFRKKKKFRTCLSMMLSAIRWNNSCRGQWSLKSACEFYVLVVRVRGGGPDVVNLGRVGLGDLAWLGTGWTYLLVTAHSTHSCFNYRTELLHQNVTFDPSQYDWQGQISWIYHIQSGIHNWMKRKEKEDKKCAESNEFAESPWIV